MTASERLKQTLSVHHTAVRELEALLPEIVAVGELLAERLRSGGTIFWVGNGGSASDGEHLAADLVGRLGRDHEPLSSLALTGSGAMLSALSNDYGYEDVFARQVRGLCGRGDVLMALSTSGRSPNVLAAVAAAEEVGASTVALTGMPGVPLADKARRCLRVPAEDTPRIQELHILVGHMLCECVEELLEDHSADGRPRNWDPIAYPDSEA